MSTCSPRETKFGSNSAGENQKETDAEGFGQLISRSCFRLLFACTSKHPPWKRSTAPANTKGKRLEGFGLGLPGKKEDDGIMGGKKRPKHIGRCLLHFLVREKKIKIFICFFMFLLFKGFACLGTANFKSVFLQKSSKAPWKPGAVGWRQIFPKTSAWYWAKNDEGWVQPPRSEQHYLI